MTPRAISFAIVLAVFATLLVVAGVCFARRSRRTATQTWEDLVERLAPLDRDNIALIALEVTMEPADEPSLLDSSQIWELIGGTEGLNTMQANCAVLIELACYVQQQYPEALAVAEQLRLNAREIQWHIDRLRGAERAGKLQAVFPEYAQRAVSRYYQMTQLLLSLYEMAEMPQAQDRLARVL